MRCVALYMLYHILDVSSNLAQCCSNTVQKMYVKYNQCWMKIQWGLQERHGPTLHASICFLEIPQIMSFSVDLRILKLSLSRFTSFRTRMRLRIDRKIYKPNVLGFSLETMSLHSRTFLQRVQYSGPVYVGASVIEHRQLAS